VPAPNGRFETLQMDVTSDEDVMGAVNAVIKAESRLDVLVNNAGFGLAGAIEDTSISEARTQFETNLFGPLRLCNAVLPYMRKQHSGLIVNISSIAGLVPLPFQGIYSASKAALESMTEALRLEVLPFGIRVALLEPGDFCTEFTNNRLRTGASAQQSVYRYRFERSLAVIERDELTGYAPSLIARQLERIIKTKSPRLRYPVASLLQRNAPLIRQILPRSFFDLLLLLTYDLFY
jgi:short-subunit dehydrogenase